MTAPTDEPTSRPVEPERRPPARSKRSASGDDQYRMPEAQEILERVIAIIDAAPGMPMSASVRVNREELLDLEPEERLLLRRQQLPERRVRCGAHRDTGAVDQRVGRVDVVATPDQRLGRVRAVDGHVVPVHLTALGEGVVFVECRVPSWRGQDLPSWESQDLGQ